MTARRGDRDSAPERDTTAALIERAATQLFFDRGFHATTIRDVAAAAGVRSASIYYHYENKAAILGRMMARVMDELIANALAAVALSDDPAAQLANLVREHVYYHTLFPLEGVVGDVEFRSLEGADRARIGAKRDEYQKIVETIVARGRARDQFVVPDVKLAVFSIIQMCNTVGVWYRPNGRLSREQVARGVAQLALQMVASADVLVAASGSHQRTAGQ